MKKLLDYKRIEKAIHFINESYKSQPSLEEIANVVRISPFHFQRMFRDWAGVSPKKFLQYISLGHAKELLANNATMLDVSHELGLSSSSRLHDLFVNVEGMTPGEFKNGGANLKIHYSFACSPFGKVMIASTPKGVCHMSFQSDEAYALADLKSQFPNAKYLALSDKYQKDALLIFKEGWNNINEIKLHLSGTKFQLKVWESLLKIPFGQLCTYGDLARLIEKPSAARAVGTAIGQNPIAYLIPCHRVIQSTGRFGEYRWGAAKKMAIIGWEATKIGDENL